MAHTVRGVNLFLVEDSLELVEEPATDLVTNTAVDAASF